MQEINYLEGRYLTTEEVAQLLGKSPAWVRTARSVLGIPAHKLGKHWRFNEIELRNWMNRQ